MSENEPESLAEQMRREGYCTCQDLLCDCRRGNGSSHAELKALAIGLEFVGKALSMSEDAGHPSDMNTGILERARAISGGRTIPLAQAWENWRRHASSR